MQIRAFSFVAILSVFAVGAVGACSSEVVTNDATSTSSSSSSSTASTTTGVGGTGGIAGTGGAGGAPTTSSSSSSTGGGDVCTQACDHAAQCGFDVCSQIMVDCNDPQQKCLAQCLLPIPCNQIGQATLFACYQKCQSGTGAGGAGGGGTGGGSPQACQQCAFSSCATAVQACGGNTECGAWFQCVQNCMPGDSQCLFACDMSHVNAKPYYDAVYTCTCSKCSPECGSVFDPCNHVSMGTGGAGGMAGTGGMMP